MTNALEKSAALSVCVSKRTSSSELSLPAATRTSGSAKAPDDSSRTPQQPIAASVPGSSLPIRKRARADRESSQSFRESREEKKKTAQRLGKVFKVLHWEKETEGL